MIKWILILSFFLPGCTYFIHNESYQFIDKSKTKKELIRVTGFSCGNKLYSDYPCMEALGCIIVEDKSYAIFD